MLKRTTVKMLITNIFCRNLNKEKTFFPNWNPQTLPKRTKEVLDEQGVSQKCSSCWLFLLVLQPLNHLSIPLLSFFLCKIRNQIGYYVRFKLFILIKVELFVSNLNIKSLGYKGGNIMLTVIADYLGMWYL